MCWYVLQLILHATYSASLLLSARWPHLESGAGTWLYSGRRDLWPFGPCLTPQCFSWRKSHWSMSLLCWRPQSRQCLLTPLSTMLQVVYVKRQGTALGTGVMTLSCFALNCRCSGLSFGGPSLSFSPPHGPAVSAKLEGAAWGTIMCWDHPVLMCCSGVVAGSPVSAVPPHASVHHATSRLRQALHSVQSLYLCCLSSCVQTGGHLKVMIPSFCLSSLSVCTSPFV